MNVRGFGHSMNARFSGMTASGALVTVYWVGYKFTAVAATIEEISGGDPNFGFSKVGLFGKSDKVRSRLQIRLRIQGFLVGGTTRTTGLRHEP